MTKIPSVEERVEEFDDKCEDGGYHVTSLNAERMLTSDRLALLTELRESGLLEEKDLTNLIPLDNYSHPEYDQTVGHNTLAKAIKAHLDELIKLNSV